MLNPCLGRPATDNANPISLLFTHFMATMEVVGHGGGTVSSEVWPFMD